MSQDFHDTQSKLALVALGGNSGSTAGGPYETVHAALAQLKRYFNDVATSGFYQTPAFPAGSGPDFVNAACSFETELSPSEILAHLHRIESDFGRTRTQRWGQRTLDLDLIACEEHVLPDHAVFQQWHDLPPEVQMTTTPETLILPHPRVQDRPFVLVPLADIAPDWVHPVLGQSVQTMLAHHSAESRAEIQLLKR